MCASNQPATLFESFAAPGVGGTCASGMTNQAGGMAMADGTSGLVLSPMTGTPSGSAYCTWLTFALGGGVIIELPVALLGDVNDDTIMTLYANSGSSLAQIQVIGVSPPVLQFDDNTTPAWTTNWTSSTIWLRMTPTDATHVAGAYGPDGQTWTAPAATVAFTGASTTTDVKLTIGASYTVTNPAGALANFAAIYTCP